MKLNALVDTTDLLFFLYCIIYNGIKFSIKMLTEINVLLFR